MNKNEYTVKQIPNKDAYYFLLNIHYAKRIPSISYTFGLFHLGKLVGVVCYGTPPSPTLRNGIAGPENSHRILELNRLCLLYNKKNEASLLVSRSLKMLPKGKIIISFADTSQGHVGYVYQACNFTYHGLSAKRTDYSLKNTPHLHSITVADIARGQESRIKFLKEKFGDNFYYKPRPRKHRYIFITGDTKIRQELYKQIRYPQQPYPKNNKEET